MEIINGLSAVTVPILQHCPVGQKCPVFAQKCHAMAKITWYFGAVLCATVQYTVVGLYQGKKSRPKIPWYFCRGIAG